MPPHPHPHHEGHRPPPPPEGPHGHGPHPGPPPPPHEGPHPHGPHPHAHGPHGGPPPPPPPHGPHAPHGDSPNGRFPVPTADDLAPILGEDRAATAVQVLRRRPSEISVLVVLLAGLADRVNELGAVVGQLGIDRAPDLTAPPEQTPDPRHDKEQ